MDWHGSNSVLAVRIFNLRQTWFYERTTALLWGTNHQGILPTHFLKAIDCSFYWNYIRNRRQETTSYPHGVSSFQFNSPTRFAHSAGQHFLAERVRFDSWHGIDWTGVRFCLIHHSLDLPWYIWIWADTPVGSLIKLSSKKCQVEHQVKRQVGSTWQFWPTWRFFLIL